MRIKVGNFSVLTLTFAAFFLINLTGCSSKEDYSMDELSDSSHSLQIENINSFLIEKKFQGSVLVAEKDKIILAKGYGSCDEKNPESEPITMNTTFEIGSITKQFTAAAILQLAEKKKLNLDDKLSLYFPDYQHGDKITIKMLLNMRSGLTDCLNATDTFFPKKIARQIDNNTYKNKPVEKDIILKYLNEAPLFIEPDSSYFYCNTNYYLLAKIIEQITGQTYEAYLQENLFTPCKMFNTNTDFQNTDTKGYDWKNRYFSIPDDFSKGYGNINSSVIDLFKWTQKLVNTKIISKQSYHQMINTDSYGYGINWQNGELFHAGITNVFNSMSIYYPEEKITVIVLANQPVYVSNAASIARSIYDCYKN